MSEPVVAGIDIGGTRLKLGFVDADRNLLHTAMAPTLAQQPGLLQRVGDLAEDAIRSSRPAALGVATAGVVDTRTGTIIGGSSNLPGWIGTEVSAGLSQRLGVPVAVDNDVNAAALGEYWAGAGQGTRVLLMIMAGTGLGAGLVVDGKLYHGAHFGGMDISFEAVPNVPRGYYNNPHAAECSIGEAGLRWQIREALAAGRSTALDPETFSIRDLHSGAAAGDDLAVELKRQQVQALSAILANVVQMIDPERVLLGGGVVEAGGDELLDAVREQTLEWMTAHNRKHFDLRPAALGSMAGVFGGAKLAFDLLG